MTLGDICVIFNPKAGRGKAAAAMARLRSFWGGRVELRPTDGPGHGEELALAAALAGFDTIGAAGGDGTVHEVANGLLRSERVEITLAVLPVGSANDYAHSLGLENDWWLGELQDIGLRQVDVGVARSAGGKQRYFINGLGLGFNGMVTLEARRIHGLRGVPLYSLALFRAMWKHFASPPMTLTIDAIARKTPTLALTIAIGRREGNFVLAPNAVIDDGLFDYLHVGKLSRLGLVRYFPRMISGRIPTDDPIVRTGRCKNVKVIAESPLMIHIDGEFFCLPEDGVREVEVRLLPGKLRVLGKRGV
jgi:diacylglycerol kinase family enzyme